MNANIDRLLNQRFGCPSCHASGKWNPSSRAINRTGSTIHRFRCRRCGEEIVVKVPRSGAGSVKNGQLAQKEYRALCELQTTFPQSAKFGTLVPLGYLDHDGCGALITRKFDGTDLLRTASKTNEDRSRMPFFPAGLLLRKLHDSCPRGYELQSLGVEGKVAYLTGTYGIELRGDPATRSLCDQLEQAAAPIGRVQLRATWCHGDFKPENILCDGQKFVILDTQLADYGVFVYDVASFLNHLLLGSHGLWRAGIKHYQRAEDEFLAGYGGINRKELAALRWAQTYFMLCYLGRYRQQNLPSRVFANWRIRPLVRKLAGQL